jgi:pimeloyl-ACP methyl ester carboxylesterase
MAYKLSIFIVLLAVIVGIDYYYNESKFNAEEELKNSSNLQDWYKRGKFFALNNIHNMFYIQEYFENNDDTIEPEGSKSKTTNVLFLHGFPSSSYDYSKVWNLFLAERDELKVKIKSITAFDFIGYGFSDKPFNYDYSIFDMADQVDRLLMHLNLNEVTIIAHDMSDSTAQELLRRQNSGSINHFKITKCILMNGGIMTSIYEPILSQYILRTKFINYPFAKYMFKFQIFKHSFKRIFGKFNAPSEQDLYDFFIAIKYKEGNLVLPQTIGYMADREEYGNTWYTALNDTNVPTIFIYGPADPINPNTKFPQKFKVELPNIQLNVLHDLVGHYPQFEDPFTVYTLIKNFIIKKD